MSIVRSALVAAAVLGVVTSGVALAQTTAPPSSISSKVDDVSKWTSKQWNRAKAKWAEEKEKWADCQKQSEDQKLTGRKSWSFLASCMTSVSTSSKIDDVSQWTSRQWNRAKAKWEKETEKWAEGSRFPGGASRARRCCGPSASQLCNGPACSRPMRRTDRLRAGSLEATTIAD